MSRAMSGSEHGSTLASSVVAGVREVISATVATESIWLTYRPATLPSHHNQGGRMFDGVFQDQKPRAELSDLQDVSVDEELHPDVGGATVCRTSCCHGIEPGTG